MRPLVIGEDEKRSIADIIQYAEENIFSVDDLLDLQNKQKKPAGDLIGHTLYLPFGYKVVFSIEDQPKARYRHLSMSVDTPGKMPAPIAVQTMLKEFGFKGELNECMVFQEQIGENHSAINVMEKII